MNCPRCHGPMKVATRMDVELDFCPQCRGIWLDGGELEKLMERSQNLIPPSVPAEKLRQEETFRDEHKRNKSKGKGFFGELRSLFDKS